MITPEAASAPREEEVHAANQNEQEWPRESKRTMALAEFREHAVQGVDEPAYPELLNRLRALYNTAYSSRVPEGDSSDAEERRRVSALKDTVLLLDEEMKQTHPDLPPVSFFDAQKFLKENFGIDT